MRPHRRFDLFSIRGCEEAFESEIQPDSITCSWQFRGWRFFLNGEADPEVAYGVSLDRDRLDVALDGARLDELIVVLPDTDSIPTEELPAGLRERERRVAQGPMEGIGRNGTSSRGDLRLGKVKFYDSKKFGFAHGLFVADYTEEEDDVYIGTRDCDPYGAFSIFDTYAAHERGSETWCPS